MSPEAIFQALGDSSRLTMLSRLSAGKPSRVGDLAVGLPISRQAARKHLDVLAAAQLVSLEPKGREVMVKLNPQAIEEGRVWLQELEHRWDDRLAKLKLYVETEEPN
jgi:DNA-binding transcriptional ArsR family regulator